MRVLHVNLWDSRGGAAIAASRLHCGLLDHGIDSRMLVARAQGDVPNVDLLTTDWSFQLDRAKEKAVQYINMAQVDDSHFGCSLNLRSSNLTERINEINPDVVHLHWVGGGMLRIEELSKIDRPIVWTLHDMWPFCGSEHCSLGHSARWKKAYSKASRPSEARGLDLTRWVWQRKYKAWSTVALTTISPSKWMQQCAANSSLWKDNQLVRHECIYNGLDTDVFAPVPKSNARRNWNIIEGVPVLLFGAQSLTASIKGGDLLREALGMATARGLKFQLLTFGAGSPNPIQGVPMVHLGRIADPLRLAQVYSAADVMLVPSRLESFGQVASEALACGTPVLCFDTSGLRDVVEHQVSGYRARCFSVEDFVAGLDWLLHSNHKESLRAAARRSALDKFQIRDVVAAHASLYCRITNNG